MKSAQQKELEAMRRVEKTLNAAVDAMKKLLDVQPVPIGTSMCEDDSRVILIDRMGEYSHFVSRKANWLEINLGGEK